MLNIRDMLSSPETDGTPSGDEEMTDAAAMWRSDATGIGSPPDKGTFPTCTGEYSEKAYGQLGYGTVTSAITATTAETTCVTCPDEEMREASSILSSFAAPAAVPQQPMKVEPSPPDRPAKGRSMSWLSRAPAWEGRFELLREFLAEHGHCNVPQRDEVLGRWVNDQRTNYGKLQRGDQSTMTDERRRLLEEIGFVWNPYEAVWLERVAELREFKEEHGHYNVPQRGGGNNQLGKWINDQRTQYKRWRDGKSTNLTDERRAVLDGMNFTWNAKDAAWYERYEELKSFKAAHGHCKVPIRQNQLGRWVDKQRSGKRRLDLSEERKNKLDELGFSWDLRRKGPLSRKSMTG